MQRTDWTPAVILTSTFALLMAGLVWFFGPLSESRWDAEPGPDRPRREAPNDVTVWVGEIRPGLIGLVGPVWGDPDPDAAHTDALNKQLERSGDSQLGWCRLLLFNTGTAEEIVTVGEDLLAVVEADGQEVQLRSLAKMVARGEITLPTPLDFTLRSVGALSETVTLAPGSMANLVMPLAHPTSLVEATGIRWTNGTQLARRPTSREDLQRLIYSPDQRGVRRLMR